LAPNSRLANALTIFHLATPQRKNPQLIKANTKENNWICGEIC